MTTALGAVVLPQLPPERLPGAARAAEAAGLAELWLWEDCFLGGGVATMTAALACTARLRVGMGVLPVPLRSVVCTAMELAAVHRMFPGRASIGVGHGVQPWMAQAGVRAASPVTLLREYLTALRALLRGETVSTAGRYVTLDAVTLDWPVAAPILVGSTGPRSLRLSGELADGTILTSAATPDTVRTARALIDEGRTGTGPHPITVYLLTTTGPGAADRLAAEREHPDAGVAGDPATVADAVHRYAAAGADTVVLQPTVDDPDPVGFLRFAAEQVAPRVAG